jgi:hypothetical protein
MKDKTSTMRDPEVKEYIRMYPPNVELKSECHDLKISRKSEGKKGFLTAFNIDSETEKPEEPTSE